MYYSKLNMGLDGVFERLSAPMQKHGRRIGEVLCILAGEGESLRKHYSINSKELLFDALADAGMYHDVGKLLTVTMLIGEEETIDKLYNISNEMHPACSGQILEHFGDAIWQGEGHKRIALDAAAYHHEKFDGTGYPNALSGDVVPAVGYLCGIANKIDHIVMQHMLNLPRAFRLIEEYLDNAGGKRYAQSLCDRVIDMKDELMSCYMDML